MRSRVIVDLIMATASALFAYGVLGCDACKKKEAKPEPAQAEQGVDEGGDAEPSFEPNAKRPRNFTPITAEEVTPLVPALTGAAQIGEPTAVAGGRRINIVLCVNANEPAAVKTELEKKVGDLGFASLVSSSRPRLKPINTIHWVRGQKDNIRVVASLRQAEYPDCKASEKKTKVYLTYFKQIPRKEPEKKAAGAPQGAAGAPGGSDPAGKPAAGATPAETPAADGGVSAPRGDAPPPRP